MRSLLWLGVAAVALADPAYDRYIQTPYMTRGTCLDIDRRLSRSMLQYLLHEIRLSSMGSLQLARGDWGSTVLLTEIYQIIVGEYLGHDVVGVPVEGTSGAYEKLAKDELDVNMELWESVAPEEKINWMIKGQEVDGKKLKAFDAGVHAYADMARSGIYVRPSEADYEEVLHNGRFYSSLNTILLPLVPDMSKTAAAHCVETQDTGYPCPAFINPRCGAKRAGFRGEIRRDYAESVAGSTENATISCKPVLKDTPSYDIGAVENMIQSGKLPLNILHVGSGGAESGACLLTQHPTPTCACTCECACTCTVCHVQNVQVHAYVHAHAHVHLMSALLAALFLPCVSTHPLRPLLFTHPLRHCSPPILSR